MRKQVEQKGTVERLSITVAEGIAEVKMPVAYEVQDMGVLWEFMQGKEAASNRARVHSMLYDCSDWRWSNVLGLEMMLWQAEADWAGNTIFCHLSPAIKSVLDTLLEAENEHHPVKGNQPTFRPSLYFATVEEGLAYARARRT